MRIVSGAQPTGKLHIGNLFTIKQWIELQDKNDCLFFIVDLHALTENPEPEELRKNVLETAIDYLALGLDPKKCSIFVQSQIKEHAELAWILNTITPIGELLRMTQFKDKIKTITGKDIEITARMGMGVEGHYFFLPAGEGLNAGLLNYPILMAADILLYKTEAVPVGEDQKQHLELTRTLARKFNSRFGETFPEPQSITQKIGSRIMALDNPLKKMSKSGPSDNYIGIFEEEKEIARKIKIAVTDSGREITYDKENKPGISNLLEIYSLVNPDLPCRSLRRSTGRNNTPNVIASDSEAIYSRTYSKEIQQLQKEFEGKGYAEFKEKLAKTLAAYLKPFKEKREKLAKNPENVLKILEQGRKKTQKIAAKTMEEVRQKVGLI